MFTSSQARLPELQIGTQVDPKEWEDLLWKPGVTNDADLVMYLRAARSMAGKKCITICSYLFFLLWFFSCLFVLQHSQGCVMVEIELIQVRDHIYLYSQNA